MHRIAHRAAIIYLIIYFENATYIENYNYNQEARFLAQF